MPQRELSELSPNADQNDGRTPVESPTAGSGALAVPPAVSSRSLDGWLIALVVITVGACCLLISAGRHGSKTGQIPWSRNSVLLPIIELLNFNYAYPTPRGNDVKWLAQGLGAAAALVTAGVVGYLRTSRREDEDDLPSAGTAHPPGPARPSSIFGQISPTTAAQMALVAFGVWAIVSHRWAQWPQAAVGEGIRNLIVIIWAVAVGRTISRRGAFRASLALVATLAATALLAIWYFYERNPVLRLEFPIGNPIFFAACMLPALLVGTAAFAGAIETLIHRRRPNHKDDSVPGVRRTLAILAGSVVVLAIVGWAFVLSDSRAPGVALLAAAAGGGAILILRRVPPRHRRLVLLGLIALALVVFVSLVRPWFRAQQTVTAGGRGASLRMRLYTWDYAKELFLSKPLTGRGQGSFVLLSQQMAFSPRDQWGRSDSEKDPAVFVAPLVGHAHSEWLEILADLGAVGFALMATSLGLTFWAGWRALLRTRRPMDKWILLGLMASLLAIVLEECGDVALRMPVLPIIFYTLIGLIWACSREPEDRPAASRRPGWVGVVALAGAVLLAWSMVNAVWRDWKGALADGRVQDYADRRQWDSALNQAVAATRGRLVLESQISANLQVTRVAVAAAAYRLEQLRTMLSRNSSLADPIHLRELGKTDAADFDRYFEVAMRSGTQLWQAMPGIHYVAGWLAQILVEKNELESLKPTLGLEPVQGPYLAGARGWLEAEYRRDRFNTSVALNLLALSGNRPIGERVDLLRIPLRLGPDPAGSIAAIRAAVRQILSRERNSFYHYVEGLTKRAEQAADVPPDPDRRPDPYAPETLRLQAIALGIEGHHAEAASLAAQAVQLYESDRLRFHYPTALAYGLRDQAFHLLLADPDDPRKAADAARRAVEAWPATTHSPDQLGSIQRQLLLCLLAAGDYGAASDLVVEEYSPASREELSARMGSALADLCGMFMDRPPEERPGMMDEWLTRSLESAPNHPQARWLAADLALDEGRTADAIEHLKVIETVVTNRQQLDSMLEALTARHRDNAELQAYARSRSSAERPATRPSSAPSGNGSSDTGKPETELKH